MATKRSTPIADPVHTESTGAVPETEQAVKPPVTTKFELLDEGLEITASTSFQVNLGNYESKTIFAAAKGRFSKDSDPDAAAEFLWDTVYAAIQPELDQAAQLTILSSKGRTPKDGTFVHSLVQD